MRSAQNVYQTRPTLSESLKKGLRMLKGEEIKVEKYLDYEETVKDLKDEVTPT